MEHLEKENSVMVTGATDTKNNITSDENMNAGRILGLIPVFILLLIMFIRIIFVLFKSNGQKTRSTQQRRTYMGSRQRPSDIQEPTIYVSPANLPPPPKYEAMAPPSYEEVVGIHYPNYQPHIQPITQPLSTALAQSSYTESRSGNENTTGNTTGNSITPGNTNAVSNTSGNTAVPASTVIPITDSRTTVASS